MPKYKFRAQDIRGKIVEGLVESATEDTAVDILKDKGYTILTLSEGRDLSIFARSLTILNKVKIKDLVILSRQFAVLVSATVPIVQALHIMSKQAPTPLLAKVMEDIADRVNGGLRLSEALGKYPKIFSNFYINMVRSGELSGKLDEVLNYLADQQERDYELSSRIKGAMIYPSAILLGLVGVGVFMMVVVVPKLLDIITETGAELPLSTKILIAVSNFMTNFWWLIIMIIVGLYLLIRFYISTKNGRQQWDLMKLYIPVFGPLFRKIYLIRFTRSLSTLIVGGVNITRALEITSRTIGNVVYSDLVDRTSEEVENGNSISTVFIKSAVVPPMVSQIMLVGEQTGRMDEVLDKLTKFYTASIDNTVRNLVSLLEPLIIVIMGGGVGLLVASIIMPIYQVATSF